jgi:hypothetical protein
MKAAQRQREDDADSFALETMPAFLAHPPANDREGRRPLLPCRRSFGPGTLVVSLGVFALLGLSVTFVEALGSPTATPTLIAPQPRPTLPPIMGASTLPGDSIPRLVVTSSTPSLSSTAEAHPLQGAAVDVRVSLPEELPPEPLVLSALAPDSNTATVPTVLQPDSPPAPSPTKSELTRVPLTSAEADKALKRAEVLLERRDVSAARLFLERAVEGGSARALFRLAETYDPRALQRWGVRGIRGAPDKAKELYQQAQVTGNTEAGARLVGLTVR